jgi:hypothetical protein
MKNSITNSNSKDKTLTLNALILFKDSWKVIMLMGLLGGMTSFFFYTKSLNKYEAVVRVSMGREFSSGNDIETPDQLMARLILNIRSDDSIVSACDLEQSLNNEIFFPNNFKVSALKGFSSVIEMKVIYQKAEQAKLCGNAVFNSIVKSQSKLIEQLESRDKIEINNRLRMIQDRLMENQNLKGLRSTQNSIEHGYFEILLDDRRLQDERNMLQQRLESKNVQQANLLMPITITELTSRSSRPIRVVSGIIGGLLLGILIMLIRTLLADKKLNSRND